MPPPGSILRPSRRTVCRGVVAALCAPATSRAAGIEAALAGIEARLGGRLGFAVDGAAGGPAIAHRADERFPMCSTFKALAAAAVLTRVDAGREALDRALPYGPGDLLDHAPVARAGLAAGRMTVAEACAGALVWSDNTAANLLLAALGGPAALTAWLRDLGDPLTRLDRAEPALNAAVPGDPRDTTTPAAMRGTLGRLLLGGALSAASRERLEGWMVAARTGSRRPRAGLPPGWEVGDKTGSGENGTANVVAILRPPGRPPLIAAVFMTGGAAPDADRDAAHAEVGRLIAAAVAG